MRRTTLSCLYRLLRQNMIISHFRHFLITLSLYIAKETFFLVHWWRWYSLAFTDCQDKINSHSRLENGVTSSFASSAHHSKMAMTEPPHSKPREWSYELFGPFREHYTSPWEHWGADTFSKHNTHTVSHAMYWIMKENHPPSCQERA